MRATQEHQAWTRAPALARIAAFVADAPLDPDPALRATLRDAVIDCFGCILLGANRPQAQRARKAAAAFAATGGPARIYGTEQSTTAANAAMLNAVAGHCMDFDDWEIPGNTHSTVVILPTLLALAGPRSSGQDLASAYLAGFEVIARLGEALNFEHYGRGWHSTATLGALGAAAAAARLLRLDAQQTACAMSLAASRAGGFTCQFGSDAKPLQAGFAAETGVITARLAEAGATGRPDVLDHPKGMASLMSGAECERIEGVLDRLGNPPALSEHGIVLKPWPGCGYTHRILDCALQLARKIPDPSAILRIDLHLPDFHAAVLPYRRPENRHQALFSLPLAAAAGLVDQAFTPDHLQSESWNRPEIRRLVDCCHVHPFRPERPQLNYDPKQPDRMEVLLGGGKRHVARCAFPPGAPQRPMPARQVLAKFRRNAGLTSGASLRALQGWPRAARVLPVFAQAGAGSQP